MIIEKIEALCTQNHTNLTALCKEITGSSGNLPTWKKDRIRPDWLKAVCLKFNISSDYLLDIPTSGTAHSTLRPDEQDLLLRFNRLNSDYQIKTQAFMIELYEKQQSNSLRNENLDARINNSTDSSITTDEALKKTGTTNSAK